MSSPDKKPPPAGAQLVHLGLFILFILSWMGMLGAMLWRADDWRWIAGWCLALAAATSVVSMTRQLPLQNVMMAAVLIALISSGVTASGAATGIPFGAVTYTDKFGPQLFETLPLLMPLVWLAAIINSRGIARLMLRPWRKSKLYGFRVIGLTCLLVIILDMGLEPFASKANRFWIWQTPNGVPAWYTAPWFNFFGWGLTTLLILAFVTPWLINKKSVRSPPDYHPLLVWIGLVLLFAVGNASHQLWWAAGFGLLTGSLATIFAWRGARW